MGCSGRSARLRPGSASARLTSLRPPDAVTLYLGWSVNPSIGFERRCINLLHMISDFSMVRRTGGRPGLYRLSARQAGHPRSSTRKHHARADPYNPGPMDDGSEIQATPVVNGTRENVKDSSTDAIVLRILSGEMTVLSHGTSQYQVSGVSACGLAALNCARIVLSAEQDGLRGRDLLKFVAKAKTAQVRGLRLSL